MVVVTVATLGAAAAASLFMAWSIGAGSSGSTPFAPAVGANAISVMRAGLVVGVLGLMGAILQGANVTEAVGTELIGGVTLTAGAAIVALLTAAALVAIGVFAGYPIATAFTVTGAVVGVGLAMGGDPAWPKYTEILTLWILTPFVGGGVAYGVARMLIGERLPERALTAALAGLVGAIVANVVGFAARAGGPAGVAVGGVRFRARDRRDRHASGHGRGGGGRRARGVRRPRSRPRGRPAPIPPRDGRTGRVLGRRLAGRARDRPARPDLQRCRGPAVGARRRRGDLVGSWTGAPRMIKAISQDYASMGPRRSISALIPSFAIAQIAVAFGIPVSFNEIIVSAIVGAGYAAGDAGVSRSKMGYTVFAWIASLVGSLALGFGVYSAVQFVL